MLEKVNTRKAWLRFAVQKGLGAPEVVALLRTFELPEAVFEAPRRSVAEVVGRALAVQLLSDENEQAAQDCLDWIDATPGADFVYLTQADYPRELLRTGRPPAVLFLRGRRELLQHSKLAVVGEKRGDSEGLENARGFARAVARRGIAIVSPLDLGDDAACVAGAVSEQGGVIVVVATGPDRIYPAANRGLFERVSRDGLLVGSLPPLTPFAAENLEIQQNILVGLGSALLVVQAESHGYSLNCARLAAEMGREVMTIPGSIHSELYKGNHRLLRDGARLVESDVDVLQGWERLDLVK